jgi:tripartite ATP-independent transporter DctM subunit
MFWPIFATSLALTIGSGAFLGAALGLTGLLLLQFAAGGAVSLAMDAVWNTISSFTMSAIPLFVLMGNVMKTSGVSTRIYTAMNPLFCRIPGGLLHTNIAVCTVFGAVSGTSMTTAAAVGSVAYPELTKRGYDKSMVAGSLAGGGTLGILIPPSITLIIYGVLTETSIGRLFVAGVLPGLVLAVGFMIYIYIHCRINPNLVAPVKEYPSWGYTFISLLKIWPLTILIAAVMGSILMGFATPTEAAAVGAAAAIVMGFVWGDLEWSTFWSTFRNTVLMWGALGFVVVGALILGNAVAILAIPQSLLEILQQSEMGRWQIIIIISLMYVVLGAFFDGFSMMIMTLGIITPLLTNFGYDPVWIGIYITVMVEISMITPPVGLNLFVLMTVTDREVSMLSMARSSIPYWLILLAGVILLMLVPEIVMYLPNLLT